MIIDQRKYTSQYPTSNIIISTAIDIKNHLKDKLLLDELIIKFLSEKNDAIINIAIQLSPNFETCSLIWNSILRVINTIDKTIHNNILAIPIVLIVGSTDKVKLINTLSKNNLNQWFIDNKIFDCEVNINNNLYDYNTLSKISISQIYSKSRELLIDDSNIFSLSVVDNIIENEVVLLKYIIINTYKSNNVNYNIFKLKLLLFANFLKNELSLDKLSLFPIPFNMSNILQAIHDGYRYLKEIDVTVKMSNFLREAKLKQYKPYAKLTANDNTIFISLYTYENIMNNLKIDWNIRQYDIVNDVYAFINNLAHDINLEISYD